MAYEAHRTQRRLEAANQLEELLVAAQQIVLDLRANPTPDTVDREEWLRSNDMAYARVYWLRRELGYVVNKLGVGLPPNWMIKQIIEEFAQPRNDQEVPSHGDDVQ